MKQNNILVHPNGTINVKALINAPKHVINQLMEINSYTVYTPKFFIYTLKKIILPDELKTLLKKHPELIEHFI
jgi:hypothetical protein